MVQEESTVSEEQGHRAERRIQLHILDLEEVEEVEKVEEADLEEMEAAEPAQQRNNRTNPERRQSLCSEPYQYAVLHRS